MAELLTTREAAELLNVTPRTVTNWIRGDRIPHLRLPGGEFRVPLEGLLGSLSGTYDLGDELRAERSSTMSERLARVHRLSRQMTAIKGAARRP